MPDCPHDSLAIFESETERETGERGVDAGEENDHYGDDGGEKAADQ